MFLAKDTKNNENSALGTLQVLFRQRAGYMGTHMTNVLKCVGGM